MLYLTLYSSFPIAFDIENPDWILFILCS